MEDPKGYNVFNTSFYSAESMVYFEKHKIFEIYKELMIMINRERPIHIEKFITDNIEEVAREITKNGSTLILAPAGFNSNLFADTFGELYKTPIVKYKKNIFRKDTRNVLKLFLRFLRHPHLRKKHLIVVNYPENRVEILKSKKYGFKPSNVVNLISNDKCTPDLQEVADYYKKISTKCYCFREDTPEIHRNIESICREVHRVIKNQESRDLTGLWMPRVILIGRRGSGRKTQAALLAKEFNLIYIDVEFLVIKQIESMSSLGEALREGALNHAYSHEIIAAIIEKRLLMPDCLNNGWVIVGYPNSIADIRLMEKFTVPPNKIIFLHTRENLCKRRLTKRISNNQNEIHPRDLKTSIDSELCHYNLNIRPMVDYFNDRKYPLIHVDGSHSVRTVKTMIWAKVMNEQK